MKTLVYRDPGTPAPGNQGADRCHRQDLEDYDMRHRFTYLERRCSNPCARTDFWCEGTTVSPTTTSALRSSILRPFLSTVAIGGETFSDRLRPDRGDDKEKHAG